MRAQQRVGSKSLHAERETAFISIGLGVQDCMQVGRLAYVV